MKKILSNIQHKTITFTELSFTSCRDAIIYRREKSNHWFFFRRVKWGKNEIIIGLMKVGLLIGRACWEINTKQRFSFRFKCGGCEAPVWPGGDTLALLHYGIARVPLFQLLHYLPSVFFFLVVTREVWEKKMTLIIYLSILWLKFWSIDNLDIALIETFQSY